MNGALFANSIRSSCFNSFVVLLVCNSRSRSSSSNRSACRYSTHASFGLALPPSHLIGHLLRSRSLALLVRTEMALFSGVLRAPRNSAHVFHQWRAFFLSASRSDCKGPPRNTPAWLFTALGNSLSCAALVDLSYHPKSDPFPLMFCAHLLTPA